MFFALGCSLLSCWLVSLTYILISFAQMLDNIVPYYSDPLFHFVYTTLLITFAEPWCLFAQLFIGQLFFRQLFSHSLCCQTCCQNLHILHNRGRWDCTSSVERDRYCVPCWNRQVVRERPAPHQLQRVLPCHESSARLVARFPFACAQPSWVQRMEHMLRQSSNWRCSVFSHERS